MAGPSGGEVRQLSLSAARVEAWSKCVGPFSIAGYKVKLCLTVSASGGDDVTLTIALTLGSQTYTWTETFSGNITYNLAIVTGLSLQIGVSNWNVQSGSVSFTLTVKLFVFGVGTTLYSGTVTIPISSAQERAAFSAVPVNSPRDLAELLGLLAQLTPVADTTPTAETPNPGSCACSPNHYRQNCTILPSRCPQGYFPVCSGYPQCNCECRTQ